MKTYILMHSHAYGNTLYAIKSALSFAEIDIEEVVKMLNIDFEKDKEESLELHFFPEGEILEY